MQQLVQNTENAAPVLKDVPAPQLGHSEVLVSTAASLMAPGSERLLMDYARKATGEGSREGMIKTLVDRMAHLGVTKTFGEVFRTVSEPEPLGASAAGEVVAVGRNLAGQFKPGDRVAVTGLGVASHAELNAVPAHLVAVIPPEISYNQACFAPLAAEVMQSVHHADIRLGDHVLVIGLGLTGQMMVQLVAAAGGRVLGVDYDPARVALALQNGAHEVQLLDQPEAWANAMAFSGGKGFDAVIICAMTDASAPLDLATQWARRGAKVVLCGKTGNNLPYAAFMEKELKLVISRAEGPNPESEAETDAIRETRQKNLQAVIELMAEGKLRVDTLLTHTFAIENAHRAYDMVLSRTDRAMGVVLTYGRSLEMRQAPRVTLRDVTRKPGQPALAMIGAGEYANQLRLPMLKDLRRAVLTGIASRRGLTARNAAEKYCFAYATNKTEDLLADMHTDGVLIATRPNDHAEQVMQALKNGKHVFVESPLAVDMPQLEQVFATLKEAGKGLMVGYGRRFAPLTRALLEQFNKLKGPRQIVIRVNAAKLPENNWRRMPEQGGRLLSDLGAYIDLACCFAAAQPESVCTLRGQGEDVYSITLKFANGSMAQILFTTEGDTTQGTEYIEVSGGGATGSIENFDKATFRMNGKELKFGARGEKWGHLAEIEAFIDCVGKAKLSPLQTSEDIFWSTLTTLMAQRSLREERTILIKDVHA